MQEQYKWYVVVGRVLVLIAYKSLFKSILPLRCAHEITNQSGFSNKDI